MRNFLPTDIELHKLVDFQGNRSAFRVGVFGYGVVGKAVVDFLLRDGIDSLRVIDGNPHLKHPEIEAVEWCLGDLEAMWLENLDVLFVGPGVDPRHQYLLDARSKGLLIIGELALLGKFPCELIAITGTNGKSTTTAWSGYLLEELNHDAFIGGNLGDPITGWALDGFPGKSGVLELSSYQLETAFGFAPKVSVMTNLASDHAARYSTDTEYFQAKSRIYHYQNSEDVCIVRSDVLAQLNEAPSARLYTFGEDIEGDGFCRLPGSWLGVGVFTGLSLEWDSLSIPGAHNAENALCAVLAIWALRGQSDSISDLWKLAGGFKGLEHRLEFVSEVRGIRYYNDSKATNDESSATALEALDAPIVWLAGGVSKGAGYAASMKYLPSKVSRLIAFGRASSEISSEAKTLGFDVDAITEAPTLSEAIRFAAEHAATGDNVLLSPACASFDEFTNFEERGRFFKDRVLELRA